MIKLDNHNQVNKLCSICGKKRVYIDYHGLYNPCELRVAKISARYYKANEEKTIARSKLYQENTNYVRKSQTQQREELNKNVEEITRCMETLTLKK